MKSLYHSKSFKLIALILIAVIFIGLTAFSLTLFDFGGNDSVALNRISDYEIANANAIVKADRSAKFNGDSYGNATTVAAVQNDDLSVERCLALLDFDGSADYLYIEYIGSGFAVYDRIGEYLYEKSELGSGPFDEYPSDSELFYGGPSEYYVKKGKSYEHVVTKEILQKSDAAAISDGLKDLRGKYADGEADEMSLKSVQTLASEQGFALGINNKEICAEAGLYFYMKSLGLVTGYDYYNTLQLWSNPTPNDVLKGFTDAICGKNIYGSCGYVALASVMLYYDYLNLAPMVNNQSQWHLMYDYDFQTTNAEIGQYLTSMGHYYKGKLSDIPNKYLTSEFLHQELLYLQYPDLRNKTEDQLNSCKNPFGSDYLDRKNAYNLYCSANNVHNYGYQYHLGKMYLPEKIVAGNPCILSINSSAPYVGEDSSHAVVAYGFKGTKGLWFTISSVTCDYGWHKNGGDEVCYGSIDINPNCINNNACIDVFRW